MSKWAAGMPQAHPGRQAPLQRPLKALSVRGRCPLMGVTDLETGVVSSLLQWVYAGSLQHVDMQVLRLARLWGMRDVRALSRSWRSNERGSVASDLLRAYDQEALGHTWRPGKHHVDPENSSHTHRSATYIVIVRHSHGLPCLL